MNAVVQMHPVGNIEAYRASTDAASLCKDIVVATASNIQGRKFVSVEGWQAIAIAHGCTAGARDVERVEGGVRAIGEIRRMSDGVVLSTAEGFVGEDEPTWYGGQSRGKTLPKRADYAIRAMAQTRAISRACRSAFAHVVVMMKAGLSTTPAEEVPSEGFEDRSHHSEQRAETVEHREEGSRQQRQAPPPLKGPIKTRAALRTACGAFVRDLHGCGDQDQLDIVLRDNAALIEQVEEEHELFWKGDGADFLGLEKEIERAKLAVSEDWKTDVTRAG